MSKGMAPGVGRDKVIEMVTGWPAQVFDYGVALGALKSGTDADIGIFEAREESFEFTGSGQKKRVGHQMVVNKAVVFQGQFFVNGS